MMHPEASATRPADRPVLFPLVLIVLGFALALPGVRLILLGGSPYYTLAGCCLIASGASMRRAPRIAAAIYAAMLLATLVWAVGEVGWFSWAVIPRIGLLAVVGLWFLVPTRSNGLGFFQLEKPWQRWFALVVCGVVLLLLLLVPLLSLGEQVTQAAGADAVARSAAAAPDADWQHYGHGAGGGRYSALAQITPANVAHLRRAWTFQSDAVGAMEGTPLKIGDSLYYCTGYNDVIALDAETGRLLWRHASKVDRQGVTAGVCRGLAFFKLPGHDGPCSERIYTATVDARLLAVDRFSGRSCADFGRAGEVDLRAGMGDVPKGYYYVTSAPQLVRGRLVVGGWVTDGQSVGEPSGVVRAFDAVTGKFAWAWDVGRPGNHAEPAAGQQYTRGTPNSWAPMSADEALGLVYVPTGNAGPDFYSAQRSAASQRYASAVVALDAATGEPRWSFQTVHHDVWDYDVASQPTLVDIPTRGGIVPALIQGTKRGEIFVLDRRTGRPVFPVIERPAPQRGLPGESLAATQPYSSFPNLRGAAPTEANMWGVTPFDQLWCRISFKKARFDGMFTPPARGSFIEWPASLGVLNWGSVSIDPERHVMIALTTQLSNDTQILTRAEADAQGMKPHPGSPLNAAEAPQLGTPYAARPSPFLSPLGLPCQQPPFGQVWAVDYVRGRVLWSHPLGIARDLGPSALSSRLPAIIGTPVAGGALMLASGVTILGGSQDRRLRAFETATGRLLWIGDLPGNGFATPMSYRGRSGRQFVVTQAGGNRGYGPPGLKSVVAFTLP